MKLILYFSFSVNEGLPYIYISVSISISIYLSSSIYLYLYLSVYVIFFCGGRIVYAGFLAPIALTTIICCSIGVESSKPGVDGNGGLQLSKTA